MAQGWEDELRRLRAPDPELDRLPVFRFPMTEQVRAGMRQVIREHLQREADPDVRRRVEGSHGRPRKRGSWLANDLFLYLCATGPDGTDAERFRAIAATLTAVLGEEVTAKQVKDRIAADRNAFLKRPTSHGPPVHTGLSATARAQSIRQGIKTERAWKRRWDRPD